MPSSHFTTTNKVWIGVAAGEGHRTSSHRTSSASNASLRRATWAHRSPSPPTSSHSHQRPLFRQTDSITLLDMHVKNIVKCGEPASTYMDRVSSILWFLLRVVSGRSSLRRYAGYGKEEDRVDIPMLSLSHLLRVSLIKHKSCSIRHCRIIKSGRR